MSAEKGVTYVDIRINTRRELVLSERAKGWRRRKIDKRRALVAANNGIEWMMWKGHR